MKTSFQFLLFILLFTFSETQAQKSDSTGTTPIMKRKSQIFMAEIKTDAGTQKGILYEADSSGIVILDSMYQRVIVPLKEMKSLKIYRSNAGLNGAKIGFLIPMIPSTVLGIVFFISSGTITNGFTEGILLIGLAAGTVCGILFAIINSSIPHTTIRSSTDFPEKYYKKLRYFILKTQQSLIKNHPRQVRLV
jgi:hypothetical protein